MTWHFCGQVTKTSSEQQRSGWVRGGSRAQGSGGGGGPCASSPGSPSRASAAVQASPGRRQIRPHWHLHLLPKCELPELGTPCCQPPRVLGVGCGLRAYESVPPSATSPPPTQLRANPGPATYWLCDLRSDNCGHTGHPPQRRGQMHVQQGCSRVESAPLRPWAQCWLLY